MQNARNRKSVLPHALIFIFVQQKHTTRRVFLVFQHGSQKSSWNGQQCAMKSSNKHFDGCVTSKMNKNRSKYKILLDSFVSRNVEIWSVSVTGKKVVLFFLYQQFGSLNA